MKYRRGRSNSVDRTKPLLGNRYEYVPKSILKLSELQLQAKKLLEEKIASGVYKLENVECFCGSNANVLVAGRDRYGLKVSTLICAKCGLIRTSPRMTQQSYASFYDCEYRALYTGSSKPSESFFQEQLARGLKIRSLVKPYIDSGIVFDIGCGAGGVLFAFQQANWQVAGVDYGGEYLEYGLSHGVEKLFKGSSNELVRLGKKSNLIILSHVLEHFLDLRAEIDAIHQLLEPDGLLYIEMPGVKRLGGIYEGDLLRLLQNAHTYYFCLGTLEHVLNCCGYELVQGNERIESVFRVAQRYIRPTSDISSHYQLTLDYLKRLEMMRRWGIIKVRNSCIRLVMYLFVRPFRRILEFRIVGPRINRAVG